MTDLELNKMCDVTDTVETIYDNNSKDSSAASDQNIQRAQTFVSKVAERRNFLATLCYYEEQLERKLGIEAHPVERIRPENRNQPSLWYLFLIWSSGAVYGLTGYSFGILV